MKGVKCIRYQKLFIILALLFVPLFICLKNNNSASAVSITSGIYSTAIFTKNFESTKTVYSQGPLNIGSGAISAFNVVSPTGIWDYTQALSFTNPYSDKTGTGFQSSIYFTMHSTNGNFLNSNIATMLGSVNLGFESLSEDLPYCTKSYEARVQDSATVQFLIRSSCPAGSYPSGTVFNQVEALVDYSPDSIFWCANDNSSQLCGSYMGVTVYNIDYYFTVLTGSNSYEQTVINQNQTIINQNQTIIDQDNQDRTDLQNTSNDAQSDASSAAANINNAKTSLLTVIGNFINVVIHPPASNCVIDADMGNMDLGDIDLCQLSLPPAFAVIGTLLIIGFIIPFAYSLIMTVLSLLKGATDN